MNCTRIFGIGLNKTGTTTLAECFSVLGFRKHVSVRRDLLSKYRGGLIDEIFSVVDANETFEDWPWPLMYQELFFRYGSGARYVLTKRKSSDAWLNSLKTHCLRTPVDQHCRLLAFGYNYPHGLEKYHLEFYERHNQDVQRFFGYHNSGHLLLEISFDSGDGWGELCEFLEAPIPSVPLPHENKGSAPVPKELEHQNIIRINEQLNLLHRNGNLGPGNAQAICR